LKKAIYRLLPLIPALLIYAYLAHDLNFTQDDAYISYRYVENYLNGDGLVYNIGERVEGFTNFGWVIYLILWGVLGVNYILISKITGFLFGIAIIVLTYFLAWLVFPVKDKWFSMLPVYLVAVNLSHAYWSPAGLETAAFSFFVVFSLYCYLKRSWWLIFGLLLLVWIRPEGALVAALLVLMETLVEKRFPRFSLSAGLSAFVLSLPYVVFKVLYYGSILPNPFYAKTGLSLQQVTSGLEYAGRFFGHYGFYGLGFIIPIFFFRRLSKPAKSILVFTISYVVYIVVVGGDVLKVHRFFLPLFGACGILITLSVWVFLSKRVFQTKVLVMFLATIPALFLTYYLPRDFVRSYNVREKALTHRMSFLAKQIKASDSTEFSVALPTIGVFGYALVGHEIIDMIGLTDTTIARHSEASIPDMETTWKESKHNSRYLLTNTPDYIVFSTGSKPSAPAERALLLYEQFLRSYQQVGWSYQVRKDARRELVPAFKRVRQIEGDIVPTHTVKYVQLYNIAQNYMSLGEFVRAVKYFAEAIKVSPGPYNLSLLCDMALCFTMLGQHENAQRLLDQVLASDSLVFNAHRYLYGYAEMVDDTAKMNLHSRWLDSLAPWYQQALDSLADMGY